MSHELSLLSQIVESGPAGWAVTGAFAVCGAAQLGWLARDLQLTINSREFSRQIRKLIDADNVERAIKLTHAHPGPVCRLAREGLEARLANKTSSDAMLDALPEVLAFSRKGLALVSGLGVIGFLLTAGALANGLSHGMSQKSVAGLAVFPVVCLGLTLRNGLRWNRWETDLREVARVVAD